TNSPWRGEVLRQSFASASAAGSPMPPTTSALTPPGAALEEGGMRAEVGVGRVLGRACAQPPRRPASAKAIASDFILTPPSSKAQAWRAARPRPGGAGPATPSI